MPHEFSPRYANSSGAQALRGLRRMGIRNLSEIRALSPLPEDAGREIDDAIHRVGRTRLNLVSALIDAGLVRPLPNWLQTLYLAADYVNDVGEAKQTMEFDVRYERAVQDIQRHDIPIFGTWEAFEFGSRLLSVAEGVNWPLETNHVEQGTRNVNFTIEKQGLFGLPFNIDGRTAPGILTDPLNTYTYIDGESWTAAGHSGEDIKNDVSGMVAKAIEQNYYGPYALAVGTTYNNKLNDDYKLGISTPTTTIRQRLSEMIFAGRPLQIIPVDLMPVDTTALIQMTSDVIDVVVGQGPQSYSWEVNNGPFSPVASMVLACEIVGVHLNYNGTSGIVVGNKT